MFGLQCSSPVQGVFINKEAVQHMSKGAHSGKSVSPLVLALLLVILLLAASQTSARASAGPAGSDFAHIDRYVQSEMQAASIPGLAYGIVKDGQVIHLAAFGVSGPDGRPMTVQTPMQIGSVGKTITALAIRQFINAGKLDPGAALQCYLPWFRLADARAAQDITIRDLLAHTSGLSTGDGQDPTLYREGPSSEDLVRGLASVRPDRPVGSSYEYSNLNYLILGVVVQAVSGQSYEQYVQQHIFAPLDMRQSYLSEA